MFLILKHYLFWGLTFICTCMLVFLFEPHTFHLYHRGYGLWNSGTINTPSHLQLKHGQ